MSIEEQTCVYFCIKSLYIIFNYILYIIIYLIYHLDILNLLFSAVCSSLSISPPHSPFFCLDLVYISVLLQELGFPPHTQLRVSLDPWLWLWISDLISY